MSGAGSLSCPTCGHQVELGTPTCGNCGRDMSDLMGPQMPAAGGRVTPNVVTVPFPWARIGSVLVVLITAGAGFFVYQRSDEIRGAIEDVTVDLPGPGPDFEVPAVDAPVVGGHRNVQGVVRALRAGGFSCTGVDVQASNSYVASGSCLHDGFHVQINIYLTESTVEFGRDFYEVDPIFPNLRLENAFISSSLPVMRDMKRALGGKLNLPMS